jgi:hypothetical protein
MYPRAGAPLLPDVLTSVLGDEPVSPAVLSALGLRSGMRLSELDAALVSLGEDAAEALAGEVVRCATRRWSALQGLQTPVSLEDTRALELELSVRARNGLLRMDYRHRSRDAMAAGDPTVGQLASIPGFGARSLLEVLSARSVPRGALTRAARGLARAPWSGRVSRDDPRLGRLVRALNDEAQTAREAAERVLSRGCPPEERHRLVAAIDAITVEAGRLRSLRLDDELRSILYVVLEPYLWRDVALMRLGLGGGSPLTLDETARAQGMTLARVRGIEKRLRERLVSAGEVWAPALDRALRVIRHTSPTTSRRLQADLAERGLIPEGFSTASVLAAARLLDRPIEIYAEEHGLISSRPLPVTPERLAGTARRLTTHWGATTVDRVCAGLREEEASLIVPARLARLLLETRADVRWLDERGGWFWLPAAPRNRVLNQVEKIMSVAPSVSIAELADGVARPRRMQGLALPRHVLARLCVDSGRYERSGQRILRAPGHPAWKDVLARNEATLVRTLLDHGPLMRRADLQRIAVGEQGLSLRSFVVYLHISPVLVRYAHGVYGLRGTQATPAEAGALSPTRAGAQRRGGVGAL